MLNQKALWTCPICRAEHMQAVEHCKRCGCYLLLLNKIKLHGWVLAQQGKTTQTSSMIPLTQLHDLLAPLPPGWIAGPGFLMIQYE